MSNQKTTYDNPDFSKRIREQIEKDRHGRSQAAIARRLGCRVDTFNRYVLGKRKMPPRLIHEFCKILSISGEAETDLIRLAGEDGILFSKFITDYDTKDIKSIGMRLNEWKIVHSNVQNLLFSIDTVVDALEMFKKNRNESNANEIERLWFRHCEPKAKKIRESFAYLNIIQNPHVDELFSMLQGEDSVIALTQRLIVSDTKGLQELQSATYTLIDAMKETLIVADYHIVQIANSLIEVDSE